MRSAESCRERAQAPSPAFLEIPRKAQTTHVVSRAVAPESTEVFKQNFCEARGCLSPPVGTVPRSLKCSVYFNFIKTHDVKPNSGGARSPAAVPLMLLVWPGRQRAVDLHVGQRWGREGEVLASAPHKLPGVGGPWNQR